jgi:NADH:ubiquinone oxidoreductase subunit 2 (subunit N)
MKGMARSLPLPTGLFILAAFSIIGLPPSVGWVLKGLIFNSIECTTLAEEITITCLIISSLMACYYYLKPIYFMLSPASTEERPEIFYRNTNHLSLITFVIYSLSFVLFIYIDTIIACIDSFLKK